MEFHMLLFFFFLNIRTIYQLIYQRLFYLKLLFYSNLFLFQNLFPFFMQSHIFLCLYTIQVCEFYAPLSFFLFLHFVQISNMDDNTNYQEDYEKDLLSDIFPLREQTSNRKKSHVWDHYKTYGIKKT